MFKGSIWLRFIYTSLRILFELVTLRNTYLKIREAHFFNRLDSKELTASGYLAMAHKKTPGAINTGGKPLNYPKMYYEKALQR